MSIGVERRLEKKKSPQKKIPITQNLKKNEKKYQLNKKQANR